MEKVVTRTRLVLGAAALLALLVVPVAVAGTAGPQAEASGLKGKVKKLTKQVQQLQQRVDELARQPGPQGPDGPQGLPGPSTGPAGGDLTGNYPNPQIAQGAVDSANVLDGTLTGADLEPDGLTGANISESSLGQVPSALVAAVAGVGRANGLDSCDPESASFITCTFVTLDLPAQARVVMIGHASALAEAGQDDGTGRCRLATSATGEVAQTNSLIRVGNDPGDYENAALSGVTPALGPGPVDFGIECLEDGGGAVIFQQTGVTAMAISPD
jgi:outer membrane murein-binding lipoprotein Lpp